MGMGYSLSFALLHISPAPCYPAARSKHARYRARTAVYLAFSGEADLYTAQG